VPWNAPPKMRYIGEENTESGMESDGYNKVKRRTRYFLKENENLRHIHTQT